MHKNDILFVHASRHEERNRRLIQRIGARVIRSPLACASKRMKRMHLRDHQTAIEENLAPGIAHVIDSFAKRSAHCRWMRERRDDGRRIDRLIGGRDCRRETTECPRKIQDQRGKIHFLRVLRDLVDVISVRFFDELHERTVGTRAIAGQDGADILADSEENGINGATKSFGRSEGIRIRDELNEWVVWPRLDAKDMWWKVGCHGGRGKETQAETAGGISAGAAISSACMEMSPS